MDWLGWGIGMTPNLSRDKQIFIRIYYLWANNLSQEIIMKELMTAICGMLGLFLIAGILAHIA